MARAVSVAPARFARHIIVHKCPYSALHRSKLCSLTLKSRWMAIWHVWRIIFLQSCWIDAVPTLCVTSKTMRLWYYFYTHTHETLCISWPLTWLSYALIQNKIVKKFWFALQLDFIFVGKTRSLELWKNMCSVTIIKKLKTLQTNLTSLIPLITISLNPLVKNKYLRKCHLLTKLKTTCQFVHSNFKFDLLENHNKFKWLFGKKHRNSDHSVIA